MGNAMKKIKVAVYNLDVRMYIGKKEAKEFEKISGVKIEDSRGCVYGSDVYFKKKKPSINTIAHEASHLAYEILYSRGVNDEEARAYLTGYLVEQIVNLIS